MLTTFIVQIKSAFALKTRYRTMRRAACVLVFALNASLSSAIDYNVSGFASFGLGKVYEDRVFMQDYDSKGWSSGTDNVLGLQLQAFLADRLSLTVQGISRGNSYDETLNEYEPELDWLFLSYEISPQWRTRLGRLRTPHYLFSETMEVGYSYVWVRPPVDVYTPLLEPLRNFNGIDFTYGNDYWIDSIDRGVFLEAQFFTGVLDGKFEGNDIHVEPAIGMNIVSSVDRLKVRYGFIAMQSDISNVSLEQIRPMLYEASAVAPTLADVADSFIAKDEWYQYHGYGFSWEDEHWSLSAEQYFIMGSGDGLSNDARGYYISTSYQIGPVTPYAVYGRYKNRFDHSIEQNLLESYNAVPRGVDPGLDSLRDAATFAFETFNVVEKTYTIGARWDIVPNLAAKLEFQHFRFSDDSSGHMFPQQLGVHAHAANLTTLVLDVVF